MQPDKFDIVILGGGNAAMGVTKPARDAGLSVAMIENRDLGGTCPNRGCTPKKVLVAAAHCMDEIRHAPTHGIQVGKATLDWKRLIRREKGIIRDIPGRLAGLMDQRGVEVIRETGRFAGTNTIRAGERLLEARHIVIATGSRPRDLPIPGAEHMSTSDDVLSEETLPGAVVFIGGGVISFEFAHVMNRAGSKVTILEATSRLLGEADADAVEVLRKESERIGIAIRTGVSIETIERKGSRYRLSFSQDGKRQTIAADRVVNGAGRIADVATLDLDTGKVRHDKGRIEVDKSLRSASNPAVHVCGDALWSTPQLSPVATYEGQLVGRNIAGDLRIEPDYSSIPSCVFTIPELASVGMTEAKATKAGRHFRVQTNDMTGWLSARTFAERVAWSKILVEEKTDRILGAHFVGHRGEELIHVFALAMRHGITAKQLTDGVYGFPTFSADIKSMM